MLSPESSDISVTLLLVSSYSRSDAGHALYDIECHLSNGEIRMLRKRYSEFLALHDTLKKACSEVNGFSFPTRSMSLTMDKASVLRTRRLRFEEYINKVDVMTKTIENKEPLRIFMEWIMNGWLDEGNMHCAVLSRFQENSFAVCIENRMMPPEPTEDEVLVQVFGAGLSCTDVDMCQGKMPFILTDGLPFVLGRSWCGLVVKGSIDMLGKVVMGTGVCACGEFGCRDGSLAQFIVATESSVVEKPTFMSTACASCIGVPLTTAWVALHDFILEPAPTDNTADTGSMGGSKHGSMGSSKHGSMGGSRHGSMGGSKHGSVGSGGVSGMSPPHVNTYGWPRTSDPSLRLAFSDPLAVTDCVVVLGFTNTIGCAVLELAKLAGCPTIAVNPSEDFVQKLAAQVDAEASMSDHGSDAATEEWEERPQCDVGEPIFALDESPEMSPVVSVPLKSASSIDELSESDPLETEEFAGHVVLDIGPGDPHEEDWFDHWRLKFQKTVLASSHGRGAAVIVDCVGLGLLTHAAVDCASRGARVRIVDSVMTKVAPPLMTKMDSTEAIEPDGAATNGSPVLTAEKSPPTRTQVGTRSESRATFAEVGVDARSVSAKQLDLRAVNSLDISAEHGACILRQLVSKFHSDDKARQDPSEAALTPLTIDPQSQTFNLGQSLEAVRQVASGGTDANKKIEYVVVCPSGVDMLD